MPISLVRLRATAYGGFAGHLHRLPGLIADSLPPERRADLELVKNLIHNHTRKVARYRCDSCGFKARQFYWRCPGCGAWESYPPRRTEEFDLTP